MDKNGLDKRVPIVAAVAATAIVLFGGFAIPSVYAKKTHFEQDFESSAIPYCTIEEVIFSGTAVYDFKEKDGSTFVHLQYKNTKGIGIESGTKYIVHENDKYSTILNKDGDTTLRSTIHGSFISSGPGTNTKVEIKIVTVIHANGDITTLVEDTDIKCPGSSGGVSNVFE